MGSEMCIRDSPISTEDFISTFSFVNNAFRDFTDVSLRDFFSKPRMKNYIQNSFSGLLGKRHKIPFGEEMKFYFDKETAGSSYRSGIFLTAGGKSAPVVSANDGIIIFADDLGIYGQTVIVDHGFGIASMYSQLSKIDHREGYEVEKGERIGYMGSSGISSEVGALFEVRVHGIVVNPFKWLDGSWVRENLLEFYKGLLRE